jgi:hypothetical protein
MIPLLYVVIGVIAYLAVLYCILRVINDAKEVENGNHK